MLINFFYLYFFIIIISRINTQFSKWKQLNKIENLPTERKHSFLIEFTSTNKYIFGGYGFKKDRNESYLNDLYLVDLQSSLTITEITMNQEIPPRQSCIGWKDAEGFYIYGGYGINENDEVGFLSDLYYFSVAGGAFAYVSGSNDTDVKINETHPGSLEGAVVWENGLGVFIFGGRGIGVDNSTGYFNNIWIFDKNNEEFTFFNGSLLTTNIFSSNEYPGSRFLSSGWTVSNMLYLYGGYGYNDVGGPTDLFDFWRIDIANELWEQLSSNTTCEQQQEILYPRYSAYNMFYSTSTQDIFYIFGGSSNNKLLNDLWIYNQKTQMWIFYYNSFDEEIGFDQTGKNFSAEYHLKNWPGSRKGGVAFHTANKIYIFSGEGFNENTNGLLNELWMMEIDNRKEVNQEFDFVQYVFDNMVPIVSLVFMLMIFPCLFCIFCCILVRCTPNDKLGATKIELDDTDQEFAEKLQHTISDHISQTTTKMIEKIKKALPESELSGTSIKSFFQKPMDTETFYKNFERVEKILKRLTLEKYIPIFMEKRVIFDDLDNFDDKELSKLIPEEIHRKRMMKYIIRRRLRKSELKGGGKDPKWMIQKEDIELGPAINSGAFGVIRKGILHIGLGEIPVAIKEVVLNEMMTRQNIMHEVEVMNKLKHEFVLKCFGAYFEEVSAFVVMELCEKGDLFELKKQNLAKSWKLEFIRQIAQGMKYMHSKGFVHRDLKPQNILISNDDKIRICDFGTSKKLEAISNTFCGTCEYLAPEQMTGETAKNYDPKLSDIYSFGLLAWELWTGVTPFYELVEKGCNQFEMLNKIHKQDQVMRPDLKHSKLEDCPRELSVLIEHCWDADPNKRPQSFDDINDEIDDICKNETKKSEKPDSSSSDESEDEKNEEPEKEGEDD